MGHLPAFLRNGDTALDWAKNNLDLSIDDGDEDVAAIQTQDYENKAYAYSYFASYAAKSKVLPVYRMICVPRVEDIQLHNLGKAWSKEKRGAGCYGHGGPKGSRDILVEGIVQTKDIDWAYGFASFMTYGQEQWEVSMDEDSPVLVTAIDGKKYDPPLKGSTGHAQEEWKPKPMAAEFRSLAQVRSYGRSLLRGR
jgi:hypothetical protein